MDTIVGHLAHPLFGPLFAFLAGVLTSASPCAIGAMPLLFGHIAATGARRIKALIFFIIGMALALSGAGLLAAMLGKSVSLSAPWIRWVAGLSFMVGGVMCTGLFGPRQCKVGIPGKPTDTVDYLGSVYMGVLYGLSTSPCGTPALVAILGLVAATGKAVQGALLLLTYSLGQSALLVLAALAASGFREVLENQRNLRLLSLVRLAGGVLIFGYGAYVLIAPCL